MFLSCSVCIHRLKPNYIHIIFILCIVYAEYETPPLIRHLCINIFEVARNLTIDGLEAISPVIIAILNLCGMIVWGYTHMSLHTGRINSVPLPGLGGRRTSIDGQL